MSEGRDVLAIAPLADIESGVRAFTEVLEELQSAHRKLEERARRVEAELCLANERLADKVGELDQVKRP